MIQASVCLSPLGDFSLPPRLAPLCQESPGDVMISSTAHALEGPEDLPGETQQSLESRGRSPMSSWPPVASVWWGVGAVLRWALVLLGRAYQPLLRESRAVYRTQWAHKTGRGGRPGGIQPRFVGHWLGDSSVPGLSSSPPHPTLFFFFSWRGKDRPASFFLQS